MFSWCEWGIRLRPQSVWCRKMITRSPFLLAGDDLGSSVLFDSTSLLGVTRIGPKGHFWDTLCLGLKTSLRAKPFIWKWAGFAWKIICWGSTLFMWMVSCTKPCFDTQAKGNLEMASWTNNKYMMWIQTIFRASQETVCVNYFLFSLFSLPSQQPVFRGEDHLHSGGASSGPSSTDGNESSPYPVYENGNILHTPFLSRTLAKSLFGCLTAWCSSKDPPCQPCSP